MNALEHVVRSFARRTVQNGDVALVSDGHPALVAAFKELGWSDPYVDPTLLPPEPPKPEPIPVKADPPKGRVSGL